MNVLQIFYISNKEFWQKEKLNWRKLKKAQVCKYTKARRHTCARMWNLIKAGFVEKPEDYLYSSARNYYGMKGLTEIDLLDPLIITV